MEVKIELFYQIGCNIGFFKDMGTAITAYNY